jgi:hypothetical protein
MSGRIGDIGSAVAPRPPSSTEPLPHERVDESVNTVAKLDRLVALQIEHFEDRVSNGVELFRRET